jgi:hypothetical protein
MQRHGTHEGVTAVVWPKKFTGARFGISPVRAVGVEWLFMLQAASLRRNRYRISPLHYRLTFIITSGHNSTKIVRYSYLRSPPLISTTSIGRNFGKQMIQGIQQLAGTGNIIRRLSDCKMVSENGMLHVPVQSLLRMSLLSFALRAVVSSNPRHCMSK